MRDGRVRFGLGVAAFLVLFALVLVVIDRVSPSPSGPRSSSYATAPDGVAAYASVLARAGHPVERLRTPIAKATPQPGETLMVLEPDVMEPSEARAIGRWVRGGGRLVAGDTEDTSWLEQVLGKPPEWSPDGAVRHGVLAPVPGVRQVLSSGDGSWTKLGGALPILGPAADPLAVVAHSGSGSVTLLADVAPLQNGGLARADNAAFGLSLSGGPRRPVAFLETVHGYGVSRGFGGLPANVKWTLIGLALTAIFAAWAAGRRFGPPEDPEAPLPPPRVEYVEALAASLARAKEDRP